MGFAPCKNTIKLCIIPLTLVLLVIVSTDVTEWIIMAAGCPLWSLDLDINNNLLYSISYHRCIKSSGRLRLWCLFAQNG
jgi:hypothetical protein